MHPTTKVVLLALCFIAGILAFQAFFPFIFFALIAVTYGYHHFKTHILKESKMYQIIEQKPNSVVLQDTVTMEIIEVSNAELEHYIESK